MGFEGFSADTLPFLAELGANNDKAWFDAHRDRYEAALIAPAKAFVTAMKSRLPAAMHCEPRVNGSIFRIQRDTRFSKDKRPYKDHLDLMFWEGTGRSRECPALFFRLTPTALHVGGGIHGFDKDALARFRERVAGSEGEALPGLISEVEARGFVVGGEKYKRVPAGYDADHPRATWLKYGGLHAFREVAVPASLPTPAFADEVAELLLPAYPVVRWLAAGDIV